MPDVKPSGMPADTSLDDNHYLILNDPVGPTTKTTTLGVLRTWLRSIATWVTSPMIDWSSMSLNMKSAGNAGGISPGANADTDFGSSLRVQFTVAAACNAFVSIHIGCSSQSDFEFRVLLYLDGVQYASLTPAAAAGNAANRATVRSFSQIVPLTAGAHTISGGIGLNSATAPSIAAGGAKIAAIVQGNVTA